MTTPNKRLMQQYGTEDVFLAKEAGALPLAVAIGAGMLSYALTNSNRRDDELGRLKNERRFEARRAWEQARMRETTESLRHTRVPIPMQGYAPSPFYPSYPTYPAEYRDIDLGEGWDEGMVHLASIAAYTGADLAKEAGIGSVFGALGRAVGGTGGVIRGAGTAMGSGIRATAGGLGKGLGATAGALRGGGTAVANAAKNIGPATRGMLRSASTSIGNAASSTGNAFRNTGNAIRGTLQEAGTAFKTNASSAYQSAAANPGTTLRDFGAGIKNTAGNAFGKLRTGAGKAWDATTEGAGKLRSAAGNQIDKAKAWMNRTPAVPTTPTPSATPTPSKPGGGFSLGLKGQLALAGLGVGGVMLANTALKSGADVLKSGVEAPQQYGYGGTPIAGPNQYGYVT